MHQGESNEWREIAAALGMDVKDLERLLPELNSLGKAYLAARANGQVVRCAAVGPPPGVAGLTRSGWRKMLDCGLAKAHGKNGASRRALLTKTGLAVLQAAIPLGALRPIYNVATHKLTLAGHMILKTSVQGKNLSAVLKSLEDARWSLLVEKPLAGRRCAGDPQSLRAATSMLSHLQGVIDFHACDGAVTWNWRPEDKK